MGIKCLAQEHNTVPRPGLKPGPFDPESSGLTISTTTKIPSLKYYNDLKMVRRKLKDRVILIERFSIECRKAKTKVITTANQNKGKYNKGPMRTQSKYT